MPTLGTNAFVEVTTQLLAGDPPRDFIVNTFALNTGAGSPTTTQWQALADAIKNFWSTTGAGRWGWPQNGITVNVYNRADPKPRPEKGHSAYVPSTWMTAINYPRQTALCVSFYSGRNLKRQRGRMYFTPANNVGVSSFKERPATTDMQSALGFVVQLAAMTSALTPVWSFSVHSDRDDFDYPIDHYWVNDVWDTQRRRAPKETTRLRSP